MSDETIKNAKNAAHSPIYGQKRAKADRAIFIVALLAIPVAHWIIFWLYINIQSIVLAFQDSRTDAFTLANFTTFWDSLTNGSGDSIGIAIKNTLLYFFTNIAIILPLSLVITFFIYKRIMFYKTFRVIFYLPAIVSSVAMVTVFSQFIDPMGPLGVIAKLFGGAIPPEGLLGIDQTATMTIVFYTIWTGFAANILLLGGAMSRIPIEVLESAKIEGCGPFREVISIIFPLIWPTISTVIIFSLTGIFNAGGPILLFTNGDNKTTTLSFWIFKQVYGNGTLGGTGNYNLVSCAGLCFTLVGVPLIMTIKHFIEKISTSEY